jgi:hypothetical protein
MGEAAAPGSWFFTTAWRLRAGPAHDPPLHGVVFRSGRPPGVQLLELGTMHPHPVRPPIPHRRRCERAAAMSTTAAAVPA